MTTTPTPTQPPNPSSASKKTAAHSSTASYPSQSPPAPRSMPSPVALRKEAASKTPINHPTVGSSGSKTLGGTPMLASLSQQGIPSSTSPNTALLASFGTPVGLGVGLDGVTPGGGPYLPTLNLGGTPMIPSMSELGLKRNDDDERRLKMRRIIHRIGRPKGRVSEEGIARASRRVGFQNDIDAEKLTPEEQERRVGNRSISIAGNKLVIDIELKSHVVGNVQVIFDSEDKELSEVQAPAVAKVLLDDLKAPDGITLNAKLDRFSQSLERLASIDRLCSGQINCFEALSGVHSSLSRLYEQERKLADDLEVMCKRSGRPRIHANGRLGLVVEYWQHRRFVKPRPAIDGEDDIYKLRIEVASTTENTLPALCVSDAWLPETFELSKDGDLASQIPWQDPRQDNTAAVTEDALVGSGTKIADLHFVARLEPPVVIEYTAAIRLLSLFGLPAPQLASFPPQYHILNNDFSAENTLQPPDPTPVYSEKHVLLPFANSGDDICSHLNTLTPNETPEYGWRIDELPFSHPRQLIEILPLLRQWAQFGNLLRGAFSPRLDKIPLQSDTLDESIINASGSNGVVTQTESNSIIFDFYLQCLPVPSLTIDLPLGISGTVEILSVQVQLNGEIVISPDEEDTPEEQLARKDLKKVAQALDRCADVDVWLEWLRANPQLITG